MLASCLPKGRPSCCADSLYPPFSRGAKTLSSARTEAIAAVTNYKSNGRSVASSHDLFGSNVFGDKEMKDRLPKSVYKALQRTIRDGEKLDASVADSVAQAMKDWSLEKGATHYAHVF